MKSFTTICLLVFSVILLLSLVSAASPTSDSRRYNYRRKHNNVYRYRQSMKKSRVAKKPKATPTATISSTATTFFRPATTTIATSSAMNSTSSSSMISSSMAPAPTTSAGSGGGNGTTYSGEGTWFNIGLGSCGETNTDTELVAAMNAPQMNNGANPNHNPMCGKKIEITNPTNNKSVVVKIVDTCPPCLSGSVDLSPAAFSTISDMDLGRIKIKWQYVN